jgi:hypothetical protein
MGFEMAGSDRYVLHVRRPFNVRTKGHRSVLAREESGFLFCPESETTSPKLRVCSREDIVRCSDWTCKQRIGLHEGQCAHVTLKLNKKRVLGTSKQLVITTMSGHWLLASKLPFPCTLGPGSISS